MSVFESTLQTLLAHTETLGLNEGDYLQVCNAMKEVFQKKPVEKKIRDTQYNTTQRIVKMKNYTFECLSSTTTHYMVPHAPDHEFKLRQTNPKGLVTERTVNHQWVDYMDKMMLHLRPQHIEQIFEGVSCHTNYKEFMEEAKNQDALELTLEAAYEATPGHTAEDYSDDHYERKMWRGEYSYWRFTQQYRFIA